MSGMWTYFTRRLLLVPVTFIVITFIVYAVLRITPGGPIEQLENQMLAAAAGEAGGGGGGIGGMDGESAGLDEKARDELKAYYNLDQPIPLAYLQWLGVYPKKTRSPVTLDYRRGDPDFWQQSQQLWNEFREAENRLQQ